MNYSVTTRGFVKVYQIKTSNLQLLPKDCLTEFALKCKNKMKWIAKRMTNISETNANVLNEDSTNRIYQMSIASIQRKFPQASSAALRNLRNFVLKDESHINKSTLFKIANSNTKAKSTSNRNMILQENKSFFPQIGYERLKRKMKEKVNSSLDHYNPKEIIKRKITMLSQAMTLKIGRRKELIPTILAKYYSMTRKNNCIVLPDIFKTTQRRRETHGNKRAYSLLS